MRRTLKIRRRVLRENHPDTNASRYDLACWLAFQGRMGDALSMLREALDNDWRRSPDPSWVSDDADLAYLHGDPGFEAIVEELRRRNEEGEATTDK